MSIGLKVNDMVPSGMLGTQQWYSQPEMQQQLQLEMEVMKPHVGEIKWGVNVGMVRFLYKGIIIKHNKTEPTYTKTSLFLCEKRRFFMARTEKGVVTTI